MRIGAFITFSADIHKILDHIGVAPQAPRITPARGMSVVRRGRRSWARGWRLGQTGISQTNHRQTTQTISALRGDLDNSDGTAAGAGLCLWGTFAAHSDDGGANSWEIRLATVGGSAFCGPILGAYLGLCGWNSYPYPFEALEFSTHSYGADSLGPPGPMGPSRMVLSKPVIAAVCGAAVAGGMELVLWCDMRVMEEDANFGVFCRRFGVPLIDGGTVRLPRLIGMGHAMDLILTGRKVEATEALQMGLCNRVVPKGDALSTAITLAEQLAGFPQQTMLADRVSAYAQWDLDLPHALHQEWQRGKACIASGLDGAVQFAAGAGRHGKF